MLEYSVTIDSAGVFTIQGGFMPGSVPVNIPDSNKKKKQFISLFLHKRDIEASINYLDCISLNNNYIANEGLFISAIAMFSKCFVNSASRNALDKEGFKSFSPGYRDIFDKYDMWRNKHFLHDENSMIEAISFLLLSPESSESLFGGPPSVVWNRVPLDYIQERKPLERLLQEIREYTVYLIDKQGKSIADEYSNKTRDELLKFGEPPLKLATIENPEKKR